MAARVHRELRRHGGLHAQGPLAWTLYFVAMAAISLALFAYAASDTWPCSANLLTPCSVRSDVRRRALPALPAAPEFERTSIADAIRSYRHDPKAAGARDSAHELAGRPRAIPECAARRYCRENKPAADRGDTLDAPLAWRDGLPITRRQYLADVTRSPRRCPTPAPCSMSPPTATVCVGLGAAMRAARAT